MLILLWLVEEAWVKYRYANSCSQPMKGSHTCGSLRGGAARGPWLAIPEP